MFTGLVREVGQVVWLRRADRVVQLLVKGPRTATRVRVGESVSVNGCCLTVTAQREGQFMFDLLTESLDRTNLGQLKPGHPVNLERALRVDGRLGGHFVQGHVDGTAQVVALEEKGPDLRIDIALPREFARYVVYKGSIAINGASLTVSAVNPADFSVWVIPHTLEHTNLGDLEAGNLVNLEFDILAKYVERLLETRGPDR
ncbi:MAG: riboflavin synthase [Verrucomicrobia bacterium]|jgi:riboflavin synthase|nr:riboflavin synthase [Verrucomicrobiota bacterium]MDA1203429.1 riboflavin synthase [Verrucomicrobiota bacterium]